MTTTTGITTATTTTTAAAVITRRKRNNKTCDRCGIERKTMYTRFWIAQQIADSKYTQDVQPLFKQGKEIASKKPETLISDGAPNFHNAFLKEYRTLNRESKHIAHIRLQGDYNNNKMERL